MIKVTHTQSRTVQVKQFEPHIFSYTVECEAGGNSPEVISQIAGTLKDTLERLLEKDVANLKIEKGL